MSCRPKGRIRTQSPYHTVCQRLAHTAASSQLAVDSRQGLGPDVSQGALVLLLQWAPKATATDYGCSSQMMVQGGNEPATAPIEHKSRATSSMSSSLQMISDWVSSPMYHAYMRVYRSALYTVMQIKRPPFKNSS